MQKGQQIEITFQTFKVGDVLAEYNILLIEPLRQGMYPFRGNWSGTTLVSDGSRLQLTYYIGDGEDIGFWLTYNGK